MAKSTDLWDDVRTWKLYFQLDKATSTIWLKAFKVKIMFGYVEVVAMYRHLLLKLIS